MLLSNRLWVIFDHGDNFEKLHLILHIVTHKAALLNVILHILSILSKTIDPYGYKDCLSFTRRGQHGHEKGFQEDIKPTCL